MRLMACLCMVLIWACQKDDAAVIPTYVEITSATIDADHDQGSDHHLITEMWVYADSQLLGAFPFPSTVPVLANADVTIDLFPGIRANGQSTSPLVYPFYQSSSFVLSAAPGNIHQIAPVFEYNSSAVFALVEDFESNHSLGNDLDQNAETTIEISSESGTQGRYGFGTVTESNRKLEVSTNVILTELPTSGAPVYLELEFKTEVPLAVGLRGHQPGGGANTIFKLVLFPRSDWQKVYIDFGPELQASQLEGYQLVFLADFDHSINDKEQSFFLDNLKMLHF